MSTNQTTTTELVLSAAEVADLIGIDAYEVQKLHPAYFGVPGHWRMNKHGAAVYTEKGIIGLRDVLITDNQHAAAARLQAKVHAHQVEAEQARAVPSRALIPPGPKSSETVQDWQRRADCA